MILLIVLGIAFAGEFVSRESAEEAALSHIACCPDFETGPFGHHVSQYMPVTDKGTVATLGYVFSLEPTGYIITSADTDIRPIIAYSAESPYIMDDSPANTPLDIIKYDLKTRMTALPYMKHSVIERNNGLWDDYHQRSPGIFSIYPMALSLGPYLDTQWNQGSPYNMFCPIDPMTMARCPIGCVVTAMGQIINYWEWPPSVEFTSADDYVSEITTPPIEIDASTANMDTIDWNAAGHHPDDSTMALFLYACGVSIHMQYSDEGSSAWSGEMVDALMTKWDYYTALGIWPSSPSFYSEIALDVLEGRVSHLSLSDGGDGHAIVVDGYRESGEYHVNYGWGGAEDGWYFIPDDLPAGFTTATYAIVGIMPPVITHRPAVELEAKQLNGGYIRLHWNEPTLITEDVLHYNVYKRLATGGTDEFLGSTSTRIYTDTSFEELTEYTYSVGAVYDVCGESRRAEIDQYSGIYNGWTRVISWFGHQASYAIAPFGTGGFVSAGKDRDYSGTDCDLLLIAMDLDGNTLWTKRYGGDEYDAARDIKRLSDEGYIVAGWTESYGAGGADMWLLRTDFMGDTLWSRTFGTADDDSAVSVAIVPSGGYILLGNTGEGSLMVVEIDADGELVAENVIGEGLAGRSIVALSAGGYAICGYADEGLLGGKDIFVLKIDSSLDSLWLRYYGGSSLDEGNDIIENASGELIVVGKSRSFGMPLYTTTYCMKLDAAGDTILTRFTGDMRNYSLSAISEYDDGYVSVGFVDNSSLDLYVQYLNETLDTLRTHTYGTVGNEEGTDVIQLADSGIAISAITYLYGVEDPWLLKVGGELYYGITESERAVPEVLSIRAYPNPFNSALSIEAPPGTKVQIYDVRGKLITGIEGNETRRDKTVVTWNPSAETVSGVYFIRAINGERTGVTKAVYVK